MTFRVCFPWVLLTCVVVWWLVLCNLPRCFVGWPLLYSAFFCSVERFFSRTNFLCWLLFRYPLQLTALECNSTRLIHSAFVNIHPSGVTHSADRAACSKWNCCRLGAFCVHHVGEWGWGVEQVGSMGEEPQVRGYYNITFICTPTNQDVVSVLEKTQANKTFKTWKQMSKQQQLLI